MCRIKRAADPAELLRRNQLVNRGAAYREKLSMDIKGGGRCRISDRPLTWFDAAMIAVRRPSVVAHKLGLVLGHGYFRRRQISWLTRLSGFSEADVRMYVMEVGRDREFLAAVRASFRQNTLYFPLPTDFMANKYGNTMFGLHVALYAFTRLVRPRLIVETGGTPGKFSAFILRALERNGQGHLYTIDLPPLEVEENVIIKPDQVHHKRPRGIRPNWCVPEFLLEWQTLLIGPAQERLPRLLSDLSEIDVFIHDSDHSYEHMRWELETAFPSVRTGGFVCADDITGNTAWRDFCLAHELVSYEFGQMGMIRKGER